jgi:hypothetical protein
MNYKPYQWIYADGEEHDFHIKDYQRLEADRANRWFDSLKKEWHDFGTFIYCTCGEYSITSYGREKFAHEHWESCGKKYQPVLVATTNYHNKDDGDFYARDKYGNIVRNDYGNPVLKAVTESVNKIEKNTATVRTAVNKVRASSNSVQNVRRRSTNSTGPK